MYFDDIFGEVGCDARETETLLYSPGGSTTFSRGLRAMVSCDFYV